MTTSPQGEEVTLNERLENVKNRFGIDSKVYQDAKIICDRVRRLEETLEKFR